MKQNGISIGRAGQFSRGGIHLFNNDVLDPYGLKDDATIEWTNERLFAELTAIRERVEAFPDELNW